MYHQFSFVALGKNTLDVLGVGFHKVDLGLQVLKERLQLLYYEVVEFMLGDQLGGLDCFC